MAAFCIVTLQPQGYAHVSAFLDIKLLLYYSLRDLGHEVTLATNRFPEGCTPIVFGAHLLGDDFAIELPRHCILFNTEQLSDGESLWSSRILGLSERHLFWDYSSFNLRLIQERAAGAASVQQLRLGFHPEQQRIDRAVPRLDEFLFYGSVTPLREQIFSRISLSDRLRVVAYFGVYGWQRDGLLGRSRAVLNIHSCEQRILEWVRIVPLLANAIPCIALVSPQSRCDDDQLSYVLTAPEDDPTPALEALFSSWDVLDQHAAEMQQRFRDTQDQLVFTQEALDASFSSGFAPSSGPCHRSEWLAPACQRDPDLLWYQHTYPWISDPRTLAEFHHQEGQYRQYHPDREFRNSFRPPLLLRDEGPSAAVDVPVQRIAVVLHFHHEAKARLFFAEFGPWLRGIADFYVTSTGAMLTAALFSLARDYQIPNFLVQQIDNRGRDIPSKYICFLSYLSDYDVCLFAHGKSSDHAWFYDHASLLCGSKARVDSILAMFAEDPGLGLVFPDYIPSLVPLIGWGTMRRQIDDLLRPHGWDTRDVELLEFPAGGFFWARPAALASIQQLALRQEDLPEEPLAQDHTLLHAIERLPCLSCERAGLRWEKIGRAAIPTDASANLAMAASAAVAAPSAAADVSEQSAGVREGGLDPFAVLSASIHPLSVEVAPDGVLEPDLAPLAELLKQQMCPFTLLHLHHFDARGYLPLVWRDLLLALRSEDRMVVITTCSGFDQAALTFLEKHGLMAIRRPNRGRCLGAFRDTALIVHGLMQAGVPLERLLLLNDSVLPVVSVDACLSQIGQLSALVHGDQPVLAGFTDSYERGYHLQSYALMANAALMRDMAWWLFWSSVDTDLEKLDLVGACEVGLSTAMASVGVQLRVLYPLLENLLLSDLSLEELLPYKNISLETLNPSLYLDQTLRQVGWPFVKKQRIFDQPLSIPVLRSILLNALPPLQERLRLDLREVLEGRLGD